MSMGKALLLGLGLLAVSLSGCSSTGSSGGFSMKAGATGTYTFEASSSADNYTWDLGDRLTILYGKKVTHTFDFENGKINVLLTTKTGESRETFRKDLVLGNGLNAEATFILEGATNWTILGEAFRVSATASTDPDGDALRFAWSCVRTGDAIRTTPHAHGFGGVPYATPPAGAVTALVATSPLPEPDVVLQGDMCDALGSGGRPGLAGTIEGKFEKTGIYDIYLLASDPVHPSTSGKFHFVVTNEVERPEENITFDFAGNFQGGVGGSAQSANDEANPNPDDQQFDRVIHPFTLPLNGLEGTLQVTKTGDPSTLAVLDWKLSKGSTVLTAGKNGAAVQLAPSSLNQGTYQLEITLDKGLDVDYTVKVTAKLDMDPFKVY